MELNVATLAQRAKLPFFKIGIAPVKAAIPVGATDSFKQIQATQTRELRPRARA